jgi:hypothetical protein
VRVDCCIVASVMIESQDFAILQETLHSIGSSICIQCPLMSVSLGCFDASNITTFVVAYFM